MFCFVCFETKGGALKHIFCINWYQNGGWRFEYVCIEFFEFYISISIYSLYFERRVLLHKTWAMQPPFKKRRDAIFTAVFLTVVSVSTFFCGFGFNRFLQQQRASNLMEHSTAKTRRSGLRTSVQATSKDFKRNFESCDQTWNDMDYIYPQFREDAARKINASEIDINHR